MVQVSGELPEVKKRLGYPKLKIIQKHFPTEIAKKVKVLLSTVSFTTKKHSETGGKLWQEEV